MKAVILAAGYNRRLKREIDQPKALLKLEEQTILERQINALESAGLRKQDIFVVAGYKHELIEEIHSNIILNEKYIEYDNAYSVYLALKNIIPKIQNPTEEIIILDGDLVYDADLINKILRFGKPNVIVTKEMLYSLDLKDEIILANENAEVIEMTIPEKEKVLAERYKSEQLFSYLGIIKLSLDKAKGLLNFLEDPKFWVSWYTIPLPEIVNKGGFYNFPIPKSLKYCFDIDTKDDYTIFQKIENNEKQRRFKMFSAGPVVASERVRNSMGHYFEIGHRETEFSDLFKDVKQKILTVFNVSPKEYSAFVVGGSGTSSLETVISSVLRKDKKTMVISNGAFGERIAEICEIYKIPIVHMNYKWGEYPNLREITEELGKNQSIDAVAIVHMETSTGMLNPVNQVGKLCMEYGKIFIVDSMSGFAGDRLNMVEDNIDYCITNTNKGVGGLPVLGFVCCKNSSIERSKDISPRSYSLDLFKHLKYAEKNQTPFTPQIPLFYMLKQALEELIEEGVENRIERFRKNGELMKKRLKQIGLRFQLPEEQMSNTMVNVLIPQGISYDLIHGGLKKKSYIIYPGKGPLENKILHIANIGILEEKDVLDFVDALKQVLIEISQKTTKNITNLLEKLNHE